MVASDRGQARVQHGRERRLTWIMRTAVALVFLVFFVFLLLALRGGWLIRF